MPKTDTLASSIVEASGSAVVIVRGQKGEPMRVIDADALLGRVRSEEIQAQAHGREFSTCFMSPGGTPSTEWWYVEDLIENAPTIEAERTSVSEWQKDFREYMGMLNIPRDDYNGIMEYINEVPSAQPEPRWIPCSEKLPTKPGRYLVTQKIPYGMRVTIAYFDWNEFLDEAVAWMSPPEPYKGEP